MIDLSKEVDQASFIERKNWGYEYELANRVAVILVFCSTAYFNMH